MMSKPPSSFWAWVVHTLVSSILPLLLFICWDFGTRWEWFPRSLVASPSEVLEEFGRMLSDGVLIGHIGVSLRRLSAGFFVGASLAVLVGTLVGLSRWAERLLAPTIGLLAPVPVSAWIPLVIILFGIGELAKVVLLAVGIFFIMFFSTVQGLRSTDPKLIEVARVYGKTSTELVTGVLMPWAIGAILQGARAALGLGWVLLIVVEVIASSDGLAWLMWDSRTFGRPATMIVGMITIALLGFITDWGICRLNRCLMFWRPTFEGQ
jgi:sulfonate transport system permease protein